MPVFPRSRSRELSDRVKVIIYTAKPGVVIGKGGAEIEKVKAEVQKLTDKKLIVDIKEVKRPDRDAQLVAENIALQLENRVSFRRAMKSTMGQYYEVQVQRESRLPFPDVWAELIWLVPSSTARELSRCRH